MYFYGVCYIYNFVNFFVDLYINIFLVWWFGVVCVCSGFDNFGKMMIVLKMNGEDISVISLIFGFNIKIIIY